MWRISKIITFLESLRQAGWFDLFESDIQALLIFDPLMTLWGKFDAPYLKLLNDASVASACFYVRTCRRVRNSKKIAIIRDFHLPGSFLCLSTRLICDVSSRLFVSFIFVKYKAFTWAHCLLQESTYLKSLHLLALHDSMRQIDSHIWMLLETLWDPVIQQIWDPVIQQIWDAEFCKVEKRVEIQNV